MPTPFPGMDPYLEAPTLWAEFHHQLIRCLYQIMLPGLVDRYRARVVTRSYSIEGQAHEEDYIVVYQRSDQKPVTLADVVSPTNRTTDIGRQAYFATRKESREAGANL